MSKCAVLCCKMSKKLSVRNDVMCSDSLTLHCFKQNDKKDIRLREKKQFSAP